jgi:hypothetical protein
MAMTASAAAASRVPTRSHNHSVWSSFLDAVVEPRILNVEQEIIEYLDHCRHDLPPEVWIELERRRLD